MHVAATWVQGWYGELCTLMKSPYDFKQSPRRRIKSLSFLNSHDEVSIINHHSSILVYMSVNVDAIILTSSSEKSLEVVMRLSTALRRVSCPWRRCISSEHRHFLTEKVCSGDIYFASHPVFSKDPPSSTYAMLDEVTLQDRIDSLQLAEGNTHLNISPMVSHFV